MFVYQHINSSFQKGKENMRNNLKKVKKKESVTSKKITKIKGNSPAAIINKTRQR